MENRVPTKTKKQNSWAVNVWNDWAVWRNELCIKNKKGKYNTVPNIEQIVENNINKDELGFWLSEFVLEIKRKDGNDYPPKTLYQLCITLQRHFRSAKLGYDYDLDIFKESDPHFQIFYSSLHRKMNELTSKGLGVITKSASPITMEDEIQLWESRAINMDTALGLSNGVFMYNCKLFGLRTFEEHRELTTQQYSFSIDVQSGREKLTFHSRVNKDNQRGIKTGRIKIKVIDHYGDPTNPLCAVTLFKRYLNIIAKNGAFYRRPLNNNKLSSPSTPRFSIQPVGVNKLSCYIKDMFKFAGISTEGRHISNRSVKVTSCSNSGFDKQSVQQRSDHHLDAVLLHKRAGTCMLQTVNDLSQPPKPKIKPEEESYQNSFTETSICAKKVEGRIHNSNVKTGKESLNTSSNNSDELTNTTGGSIELINQLPLIFKFLKESGGGEVTITNNGISIKID